MTLKYPVMIMVWTVHGSTADFYVQAGRPRPGQRGEFCADNAAINSALTAATTPAASLPALQANEQTILHLQSMAPSKVVDCPSLVEATRQAIQSCSVATSHQVRGEGRDRERDVCGELGTALVRPPGDHSGWV